MKDSRPIMSSNEFDPTQPVADQAAWWWLVLNEPGCTAADQQAFTNWLAKSPERVEAYMRVTLLKRTLDVDTVWPTDSAEQLIAAARQSPADVVSFHGSATSAAPMRRFKSANRLYAFAATLLALIGAASWFAASIGRYSTEFGEQRSVLLSDGSLVILNTASTIKVAFEEQRRSVHLLRGEALFRVAHEPGRPFEVRVDDTTVRAVGTQFNIDRREHRTSVTVVEGRVLVAAPSAQAGRPMDAAPLAAGEQIVVTADRVERPRVVNVLAATAWTKRRLVFEQRPLGEVAEEFGRYNRERIVIEDPELRQQQVTGDFDADRVESFIVFLSQTPGVSVERKGAGIYVVSSVVTSEERRNGQLAAPQQQNP